MSHKYIKYKNKENNRDLIRRTQSLCNAINSTEIENADYREIFDNAVEFAYNNLTYEYTERDIHAIMVNNIRHNYSNYDEVLRGPYGIRRSECDYMQYKNCVLNKISDIYPPLKDECDRQKRKCDMVICKG
jgi:hypothetical protein